MTLVFAIATAAALAGLLLARWRERRRAIWVLKPLASSGFVATAVAQGALDSSYGRAVFIALLLCWLGDVLLIPRSSVVFRLGLASFLAGHLAYLAAFFVAGIAVLPAVIALVPLAVIGVRVDVWLRPHLGRAMRIPVRAYVAVISVMVAGAVGGTAGGELSAMILVGAVLFWVSDLFVARHRFVAEAFTNRLIGLPLYYGAQLLFAFSTGVG